jgi:hypothetical protein
MGLWDPRAPELLIWERHYKKRLMVDIVWISFHGFDVWYWWIGHWKMKASNAPQGTLIYFNYVGQTDIFGWVSIPVRIINAIALLWLWSDVILASLQQVQRNRMDQVVKPATLKVLTSRWLNEIEHPYRVPRVITPDDTVENPDGAFQPSTGHSRNSSKLSIRPSESGQPYSRPSSAMARRFSIENRNTDLDLVKNPFQSVQMEEAAPPLYPRPSRTGTGLLKRGLLRWPSNKDETDIRPPPPLYTPYEPNFDNIYRATKFLDECYKPPKATGRWQKTSRCMFEPYICLVYAFLLLPTLLTHPFHGSVILALFSHGSNLGYSRKISYPQALTRALRNPAYKSLQSYDVLLASRISLTANPPSKPGKWTMISLGWATFAACSVLVISTELTINWNAIRGVNNLNTVGQLIPFCLGVGGLGKVVWAAFYERDRRDIDRVCYYGRCDSIPKRNEWKEVAEGWKKCCEAFEKEGKGGV